MAPWPVWATPHASSYENIENLVDSRIASEDEAFFRRGVRMVPEIRETVLDGQILRPFCHDKRPTFDKVNVFILLIITSTWILFRQTDHRLSSSAGAKRIYFTAPAVQHVFPTPTSGPARSSTVANRGHRPGTSLTRVAIAGRSRSSRRFCRRSRILFAMGARTVFTFVRTADELDAGE